MKQVSKIALLSLGLTALTGCGEKFPQTVTIDGVKVVYVGKAWEPQGTSLSVLSRRCPWKSGAQAAYRWSGDGRENTCLIFERDGTVKEAFSSGMSLEIRTEEFKWAKGWPEKAYPSSP